MNLDEATDEVMELAHVKRFPRTLDKIDILLMRIQIELSEAMEAHLEKNVDNLIDELIDVLIQTLQALGSLSCDVERLFIDKMVKNFGRDFKKHEGIKDAI